MATVYLARDRRHGREVAVKVLRPELAASLGAERFLNEIAIAARLAHPHIVPLFDSGEAGGFLYYVMPFVTGRSLRTLLEREPQLDPAAALAIVSQVARALDHAHRMGVLHRDVKPENILLSGTDAFVTDFGIAKAVTSAGGPNLTRTGFAMGTPGYMSPEQAAGVRDLDARTDVYGLACVTYEMLIGETPGLWPTEEATRLGRLLDASPEHRHRLDTLPGRIEQVLAKALAMRPADRFATPLEFADRLTAVFVARAEYSAAEVRRIVARAAELQAKRPTEEGVLTIGALEQVAAEVGIPPTSVREAMHELGLALDIDAPTAVAAESPGRGRYDDSEVRRIFERAIELEQGRARHELELSHTGLQEIAAEVGLLPDHIDEAVRELSELRESDEGPSEPSDVVAERPWEMTLAPSKTVVVERSAPGEISEPGHALLVQEIRRSLGTQGRLARTGTSLMWSGALTWSGALSSLDATRGVRIAISATGGRTYFRLEEHIDSVPGRGFGAIAGGLTGFGLGMSEPSVWLAAFFGIMLGTIGAIVVPRAILAGEASQSEHQLRALAARLVTVTNRALKAPSSSQSDRVRSTPHGMGDENVSPSPVR
jgi:serine/threonine protein kinase